MGLMDESTTYAKLVSRYGQFRVPAWKLLIEGKQLPGGVGVERISATLSLDGASAVSFTVAGDTLTVRDIAAGGKTEDRTGGEDT